MALNIPFAAHLAMAESHIPQTVTISGAAYSCLASDVTRGESLEMAGITGECDLNITLRTEVLASVAIGTRLTYNAKVFRVDRVNDSPCGTCYRLECVDVSK